MNEQQTIRQQKAIHEIAQAMARFNENLAPPPGRKSWFDLGETAPRTACCGDGYCAIGEPPSKFEAWLIESITGYPLEDGWWLPAHLSCFPRNLLADAIKQAVQ